MIHHHFWLSGAPTYEKHAYEAYLREVQEARATVYYAAFKAIGRGLLVLVNGVGAVWIAIRRKQRERVTRRELSMLDDHILADIGLSRSDVGHTAHVLANDLPTPVDSARTPPEAHRTALPGHARTEPRWLRGVVDGQGPETSSPASTDQRIAANDSGPGTHDRELGSARCA